ncbi:outer membrane protein assembly factor BamB family protein [Planctopirus limnophila]|nr:PQQ-binding-like beta-propeller repeat protein [Planctopirus limnophila]
MFSTITARQSGIKRLEPAFVLSAFFPSVMVGLVLLFNLSCSPATSWAQENQPAVQPGELSNDNMTVSSAPESSLQATLARQLRPEISPATTRQLRELTNALRTGNRELSIVIADRVLAIDPKAVTTISENSSTFHAVWRLRREWYHQLLPYQQQKLLKDFQLAADLAYRELPVDESRGERLLQFCMQFDLSAAGIKAWEELAARARDRGQAELAASIYFDLSQHPLLKVENVARRTQLMRASGVLNEQPSFATRSGQRERRGHGLRLLKERLSDEIWPVQKSEQIVPSRIETVPDQRAVMSRRVIDDGSQQPHLWENRTAQVRHYLRSRGIATVSILQPLITEDLVITRDPLKFVAIDRRTEKIVWTLPAPLIRNETWERGALSLQDWQAIVGLENSQTIYAQMTPDDDRLYLIDRIPSRTDGRPAHRLLSAVEMTTGKVLWRLGSQSSGSTYPFSETMFLGPPLLIDDQLLFLTEKDQNLGLYAVDREHGRLEWSLGLGQLSQSPAVHPVLQRSAVAMVWDGTNCIVTTGVGEVISIHLASRSIDWRASLPIHTPTSPFQRADLPPGYLPDEWWRSWREARLLISNNVLIGTSPESNQLSAWSLTGRQLWSKTVPDGVLVAGTTKTGPLNQQCVIVVTSQGIRAYRLHNGELMWNRSSLLATHPVADGWWLSGRPVLLQEADQQAWLLAPLTNGQKLLISATTGEVRAVFPAENHEESAAALFIKDQELWSISPQGLTVEPRPDLVFTAKESRATQWSRAVAQGDFQTGWEILQQLADEDLPSQLGPLARKKAIELLQQKLCWGDFSFHPQEFREVTRRLSELLATAPDQHLALRIELAGYWLACDLPQEALATLKSISLLQLREADALESSGAMTEKSFPGQPPAMKNPWGPVISGNGPVLSGDRPVLSGDRPVQGIIDGDGRRGFIDERGQKSLLSSALQVRPSHRALAVAMRAYHQTTRDREANSIRGEPIDWPGWTHTFADWCQCDSFDAADFWVGTALGSYLQNHRLTSDNFLAEAQALADVDHLRRELAALAMIERLQVTPAISAKLAEAPLTSVWNQLVEDWRKRGLLEDANAAEMLKHRSLARLATKSSREHDLTLPRKVEPVLGVPQVTREGFVLPSIRERNEEVYQFPIPATSWPGLVADRLDISLARPGTAIRFAGEHVESPWIFGLKQQEEDEIPLLRQAWTLHQATGVGRLLILQVGAEVMAIQPLNATGEPQPRKLWSYELASESRHPLDQWVPAAQARRHLADPISFGVADPYGNLIGQAKLITPELTAWIRGAVLEVIDTATGLPRWSRDDIPALSLLAGDSDTIVLIDVAREWIYRLDALDGTVLEKQAMPGRFPAQATPKRRQLSSPTIVGEVPRGWWIEGRYLFEERVEALQQPIPEQPIPEGAMAQSLPAIRYQLICHDLVTGENVWVHAASQICYAFPLDAWTMGLIRRTDLSGGGELLLLDQQTGMAMAPAIAISLPEKVSRIVATFDKDRFYVGASNGSQMRLEAPSLQLRNGYRQPYLAGEMTAIDRKTGRVMWRVEVDQEPWPLDVSRAYPVIVRCWTTPETAGSRGAVGHQRIHWATTGEMAAADDALFLNGYVTIEAGEGDELILRREFYSTRILPPGTK